MKNNRNIDNLKVTFTIEKTCGVSRIIADLGTRRELSKLISDGASNDVLRKFVLDKMDDFSIIFDGDLTISFPSKSEWTLEDFCRSGRNFYYKGIKYFWDGKSLDAIDLAYKGERIIGRELDKSFLENVNEAFIAFRQSKSYDLPAFVVEEIVNEQMHQGNIPDIIPLTGDYIPNKEFGGFSPSESNAGLNAWRRWLGGDGLEIRCADIPDDDVIYEWICSIPTHTLNSILHNSGIWGKDTQLCDYGETEIGNIVAYYHETLGGSVNLNIEGIADEYIIGRKIDGVYQISGICKVSPIDDYVPVKRLIEFVKTSVEWLGLMILG